jgi:spermidine/putrescine transport system ATP-binding protein
MPFDPGADPQAGSATIVNLRGITKQFPGAARDTVVALDGVSLDIQRGEFVALLGPSGCGKTTLLRILGGLETPTAGEVLIDGQDMTGVPPEKRPVNTVFQSPALFPHRTVFENIAFGPRMARVPPEEIARRVGDVLALVRLEGFGPRRVTQLSGGQSQRVALARALVNRPKVLLLDEPLSALDLKLRRAMQLELKRLHRLLRTTFVYVTHDQEEAITMADRIIILNQGRVIQQGSPDSIYRRPSTRFSADFIGESNLLAATVVAQRDGHLLADLGGGVQVEAVASAAFQPGQAIWVAIRPENVALEAAAEPAAPAGLAGEVAETLFLGAFVRYEVQLAGGQRLMGLQPAGEERPPFQPGTAVRVVWQPRHVLALAE